MHVEDYLIKLVHGEPRLISSVGNPPKTDFITVQVIQFIDTHTQVYGEACVLKDTHVINECVDGFSSS